MLSFDCTAPTSSCFKVAGCLAVAIWVSGCFSGRPPSAALPGLYSTTTGLHNLTSEYSSTRNIFDDHTAVNYQVLCPRDTSLVVRKN